MKPVFLFSIDLEDIRLLMENGHRYKERVPEMTSRYLDFLREHRATCTFFIVGDQLRRYPELIRKIMDEGHEIACHTNSHTPLSNFNEDAFRQDLEQFLDSAKRIGINKVEGFRAPVFSLTEKTQWAYKALYDYGFSYSSSVLAAKNPLFGWEEFGTSFREVQGIFEMPVTLHRRLKVPLAGGVYFRMLPFFIISPEIRKLGLEGIPLQSYFHPYDIDTRQEHFMHPGINNSKIYNWLMYYNRSSVFKKLEQVMNLGFKISTYRDYLEDRRSKLSSYA